jgi:hypothetical protein
MNFLLIRDLCKIVSYLSFLGLSASLAAYVTQDNFFGSDFLDEPMIFWVELSSVLTVLTLIVFLGCEVYRVCEEKNSRFYEFLLRLQKRSRKWGI